MPERPLIYIADDDKFISDVYQSSLQGKEMDVQFFEDGDVLLQAIAKKQPHLLVLDLHMPKVDGFAVLEFRKQEGMKFPVIVASNLRHEMDSAKQKDYGVVDYIVKSDIQLKEFWERIQKYAMA